MKKLRISFILFLISTSSVFAQLEVNDTLLLAISDEIYWGSSSELEMDIYADYGKYGSANLSDNDASTYWIEGSEGDGSGQYIWFTIPIHTSSIQIRNGCQENEASYLANNRPKNISLELFACIEPQAYVTESHNGFFISEALDSASFQLKDSLAYQELKLNFDWLEISTQLTESRLFDEIRLILKLTILDVYPGNETSHACISDINIIPLEYFELTIDDHGLLKISQNKTDSLFYDAETIFQVVELSPDSKWIIFILMPSDIENSRLETIYQLYNTEQEQFIELKDITEMYGFIKKDNKLYLEGNDKDMNEISISLDEL